MSAGPDLPKLQQRYAVAAADFAGRVRKLSEAVGSLEVDAFMTLWGRCDEARRLCMDLNRQINAHSPTTPKNLTSREEQIVKLVADGMSNKEIAATLSVSVKTVEFHKGEIYRRLSLTGNASLVRYAIKMGLVTP
jgi:DNA-binding CsgD family transcriptional regulator